MKYNPNWTENEFPENKPRDDLGIETLGEAILADLLPGITNQTHRARYYSFWAWALNEFIHDSHVVDHSQKGFYEWARSREDMFILACLADGCNTGIAGTVQAIPVWQNGELVSYPLDWKSLVSVEGGSYELYYRGALIQYLRQKVDMRNRAFRV